MANPRELAEQAFTLLQDALRASEARASELGAELALKNAPATPVEQQLDELTRRLESVEAERARWQREANQLEEIADAERAKVAQLKRKLEIAESGPEKLTKKEINFWRAKVEDVDTETRDYKTRLAALRRELADRDAALDALGRAPTQPPEQQPQLTTELNDLREQREQRDRELATLTAELNGLREERAHATEHETATAGELRIQLEELRRQVASFEAALTEAHALRTGLNAELRDAQAQLGEQQSDLREAQATSERNREMVNEREHRLVELSAELEHLRGEVRQSQEREQQVHDAAAERGQQVTERDRELDERSRQLAVRSDQLAERDQQLAQRDEQLGSLAAELAQARTTAQAAERDLLARIEHIETEKNQIREQVAGLESELTEEKETIDNLSELANERREQITKLNEQVEEANERYEEAKWRLGKAQYFERIVKRRKGLIKALLAALRAKSKANVALKAGLDGLRTHKAAAEVNQQKLLARIDSLKADLEEAEETIERHQGATIAKEKLEHAEARTQELESRINTQAELIQSLEEDLKKSRMMQKSGDEKNAEIARLEEQLAGKDLELAAKIQLLTQLQTDADDQQRRLSKLRGSESETMRLRAISEKDRGAIDALEREVAQLRETLASQDTGSAGTGEHRGSAELEAAIKERDAALTRVMTTVKEHEATIKKLSESAESWKRKYQFLATEPPDAYKTAAEK